MGTRGPDGRDTLAVVAAFLLFLVLGVTTAALGAALPFLGTRFGVDAATGAVVVSLYKVGALVAIVGCGLAGRRLSPRPVIRVLLAVFVGGCLLAGSASFWGLLLAGVLLAGLGYGGLTLLLNTVFARTSGDRAVLMVNLLNAAFGVGAVIGPLAAAVAATVDVQLVLVGAGVVAAACWAAPRCGPARAPVPPPVSPARGTSSLRPTLTFVAPFVAVGFLYAGLETATGAWQSTHLVWTGTPTVVAAELTALFWAGLAVGRIVIPAVTGGVRPPLVVCAGFVVATAALAAATRPDIAVVCYAVAGIGLGPVLPTTIAWLGRVAPDVPLATSVLLTGTMAANVVHPLLVGVVADPARPVTVPLTLAVFAAAGIVVAVLAAALRPDTAGSPRDRDSAVDRSDG